MPVLSRIVSMFLRFGELVFGAVVAGLVGSYLHSLSEHDVRARFIYTEVVAGLSILLALLWLLPFSGGFIHWPVDLFLSLAWWAVFAILVNALHGNNCSGVFHWGGITNGGLCNRWKASEAFAFLSAIFWLVSTLVGLWFIHQERKSHATTTTTRRRWYRRSRV